ncbi:MlaC/ttg2D family ABC transporter substrate-binding protein [Thiomicrorhabdus sediminis]|nr:ABC transporter substrate-binding protein [Thiomicrorhabdus sediminis]
MYQLMSKISSLLLLSFFALMSFQVSANDEVSQNDPQKMIEGLSNRIISELNTNRERYENSAAEIKVFATEYVLPFIDTPKMARYVLGKHWRSASQTQQEAFVEAFTNTLIRSYSQSLLKLNVESVAVDPAREEKPGRVTVESTVAQSDGNKSQVIYRLYLNKKTQKWMLYDVTVEGISMLLSYRKAYDSDIAKKGLDAVISEMNEKNADFNGQA